MKRASFLALFGLISLASGASGQSVLGTQGLGFPLEPLDGRSRALGSVGVALPGASLVPTDPASAARILFPSIQFTLQPHWGSGSFGDESLDSKATRFPLLGVAYPVQRFNATVFFTMGGLFDQRWEATEEGTEEFLGTTVPITDSFRSEGGVTTFQLGWGQRIGEDLSIGVGVGARAGSVRRTFARVVDTAFVGVEVAPFREGKEWRYGGFSASLGIQWDALEFLRLGGSVNWSGDLEANPVDDDDGETTVFDLPTEFRLGASGILTPRLAAVVGFSYADWQPSAGGLEAESVVGSVWSLGGGLEWAGPVMVSREFPIRLGFRRSGLPFVFDGENPVENVFSGGMGLNLVRAEDVLVGSVDLGVERGTREAGSLSESFWRGTVTFRVASW